MCRRNQVTAIALITFGAGILVGGWIEWGIVRFLAAGAAIGLGFLLLNEKCRHK